MLIINLNVAGRGGEMAREPPRYLTVEKEYYQSLEEMEGDADLRRETENLAF